MGNHSQRRRISRRSLLLGFSGLGATAIGATAIGAVCTVTPHASQHQDDHPPVPAPATLTNEPAPTLSRAELVSETYSHTTPQDWGTNLPGITSTLNVAQRSVALTFDACGGPKGSLFDAPLISTLIDFQVPATLFLNQRWIEANLSKARELAANPLFQIENHGTSHLPLSVNGRAAYGIPGTASVREAVAEIEGNRAFLRATLGVESTWFRSGTAHYDDVSVAIARDLGLGIAGFDVNGDSGATAPAGTAQQQLIGSKPGSVVLMHMNQPNSGTAAGVRAAIPQLRAAGFSFVHLEKAPSW